MKYLIFLINIPRNIAIFFINIYQKTLSPDHSFVSRFYPHGYCRYYPTCSDYSKKAFRKYGFIKGFFISTYRILRCNPWSRGGIDDII